MFKNIKIILIYVLLFIFAACSDSDKSPIKEEVKEKTTVEKKQTIEETLLQEMGLDIKGEKIIIDFNKTNNFFLNMEKKLDEKVQKIEKKIQNADINLTRDSGLVLTDDRISIDLNSSKTLLNGISELFQEIILDINRTIN